MMGAISRLLLVLPLLKRAIRRTISSKIIRNRKSTYLLVDPEEVVEGLDSGQHPAHYLEGKWED
jgi:hypothetical protein